MVMVIVIVESDGKFLKIFFNSGLLSPFTITNTKK